MKFSWKDDLPAGIVVFFVAIPLCLGIAAVSGVPAFSGLIAGIIGGIVVGALSGSQLGVSGPAAGLAVIVFESIKEFNEHLTTGGGVENPAVRAFQMFLMAVMLAGLIQIVLGYLNGGIIGYYFPSSVIKGMLAGIGLTIFFKEIPHAFGYDKDFEGELSFLQKDHHNTLSELYYMLGNIDLGAILIAALGLFILIFWEKPFMKKFSFTKIIQGPLVAILVGIGLVMVFKETKLNMVQEHLVTVQKAGSLTEFFSFFKHPSLQDLGSALVWKTAIVIAIVASLETLLCVEATDKLDPQKRITPTNRELKAQGIGNMFSGLIGGLPITQVIVRSSANMQSGAKSKLSAIIHGVLILIFVAFLAHVLNLIPRASLAAILLVVGFKLSKPSLYVSMYKNGWNQFIPFIATVFFIFFVNLLVGVAIGLALGIFEILYFNFKKPFLFNKSESKSDKVFHLVLAQDVTFLNKASIMNSLNQIPEGSEVFIDGTKSLHIHPDVIEIIRDFETHAQHLDIKLTIKGLGQSKVDPVKEFKQVVDDMKYDK
jgi:MFS superfamily sulfate permease-like transporter